MTRPGPGYLPFRSFPTFVSFPFQPNQPTQSYPILPNTAQRDERNATQHGYYCYQRLLYIPSVTGSILLEEKNESLRLLPTYPSTYIMNCTVRLNKLRTALLLFIGVFVTRFRKFSSVRSTIQSTMLVSSDHPLAGKAHEN